ncbi:MAG: hypothetical protein NW241_05455 [Bacteroidia bacterium]|nr:hypothetical protein [Bacteroidia bacterium]
MSEAPVSPETAARAGVPDEATKARYQRLFRRGLQWLGAGIFLMAISLIINLQMQHAGPAFSVTMYAVTTVGAGCLIKGLVDLFG